MGQTKSATNSIDSPHKSIEHPISYPEYWPTHTFIYHITWKTKASEKLRLLIINHTRWKILVINYHSIPSLISLITINITPPPSQFFLSLNKNRWKQWEPTPKITSSHPQHPVRMSKKHRIFPQFQRVQRLTLWSIIGYHSNTLVFLECAHPTPYIPE